MKSIITKLLTTVLLLASSAVSAQNYQLNSALSSVNLATIKKQYIVEPATITELTGSVSAKGEFNVELPLAGLDTGVPIRNDRVASIYFAAAKFPAVKVSGQFDMNQLSEKNALFSTTVKANVTVFGTTKTLNFPVTIFKAKNTIMVSSSKAVIVDGGAFGIPATNLTALAATVGNIPLSSKVPVTLNLVFEKSK